MTEPEASESFTRVAPWYDALMAGVPYEQWVRYVMELLEAFDRSPATVLDLACGTGRASRLLERRGFHVLGVDGSPEMIEEARARTPGDTIEYACQRMEQLDIGREFDLIVCLFDSLNYLTEPDDLGRCFDRIAAHLAPDGLFIFDMNGEYAFEADLFTQESYGPGREVEYSWRSHYDRDTRLCRVDMRFVAHKGGRKEEFREVHYQRAYAVPEVDALIAAAGLHVLATFDAYTMRPVRATSDRIFWVVAREPSSVAPARPARRGRKRRRP